METCAKRAADFQRVLAPPPSSNSHGTDGVGTAIESPTFSNRSQPRGRPELAGKSCFPTEVRPKLPELPAQISPPLLHQIDRAPGARQDFKRRPLRDRSSSDHQGDSAEFSAEV
ncbi:hypothetical protein Prudu_015989 [Prunus dulcis]|uniref:Uncharacterized protein n=1 Tax=Prunus dulcis TaxID=3755 RepID=A0A4Y1RKY7_PRUDU|nr:hypothetical protein Prudu_015989 [Prunus dulcis]